jgi:hypothetical protein
MMRTPILTLALCGAANALSAQDLPPKRAHHAVVYDAAGERVIVTSGSSPYADGNCCAMFNDLWAFDGARWSALPSSGPQMSGMRLAFDSKRNRVVSFGGWISGQSQTSFRALERNAWVSIGDNSEMPASEPGFVYDAARDRFVAFGGSAGRGQAHADTWEHDGTKWTKVASAGPAARQAFVMVYDERRRRTVVFGGSGVATPPTPGATFGDLWEFDGAKWTEITAPNGPGARFASGATYDSKRGLVIVFGGMSRDGSFADLWSWDGREWKKLADASPSGPDARAMGYLAYDRKRDRVVLFGGRKGWPNDLNDTWEWDGSAWKRVGG